MRLIKNLLILFLITTTTFGASKKLDVIIGAYFCKTSKLTQDCDARLIERSFPIMDTQAKLNKFEVKSIHENGLEYKANITIHKRKSQHPNHGLRFDSTASLSVNHGHHKSYTMNSPSLPKYGHQADATVFFFEQDIERFHSFSVNGKDFFAGSPIDGKAYTFPIVFVNFNNPFSPPKSKNYYSIIDYAYLQLDRDLTYKVESGFW